MRAAFRTGVAAVLLALAAGMAQARSAVPLQQPERVLLAAPTGQALSQAQVRQAIVQGGAQHGWTVAADTANTVQLRFAKEGKHVVVVDVTYDAGGFQIRYVSSVDMKYEQRGDVAVIHPFYNRWIDNLSRSITAQAAGLKAQP